MESVSQIDSEIEERLRSHLGQLQAESAIFERIVYKNKNQHRRSSYFQYLLKVRRDLRLLQSANLEEMLRSCFGVITGDRPKKVHLLESLKRRKCDVGIPNFMERLLGAARLLSQMVEPMLRAATEVSTLLAQSFFMGFSMMVLALLARLRVLVQQILLDVISVFNTVSSLSQKKHSVKINHQGVEVYREFYPKNDEFITLESVWSTDKFVLLERINKCEKRMQEGDSGSDFPVGGTAVRYQSIESFLEDDEPTSKEADVEFTVKESPFGMKDNEKQVQANAETTDHSGTTETLGKNQLQDSLKDSNLTSNAKNVAFVSVKIPARAVTKSNDVPAKETDNTTGDRDYFFKLLTGGNRKESLF